MWEKSYRYLVSKKKRDVLQCFWIGIQVKFNVPHQEDSGGFEWTYILSRSDTYLATRDQRRNLVQDVSSLCRTHVV